MEKQHSVDMPVWKVRQKTNYSLSQPKLFPGWWGIWCTIQVNDSQLGITQKEQKNSTFHLWGTPRSTHTQQHGTPPLGAHVSSERVGHQAEFGPIFAKWAQPFDSKKGRGPPRASALATHCSVLCVALRGNSQTSPTSQDVHEWSPRKAVWTEYVVLTLSNNLYWIMTPMIAAIF